jgi:hypothetical protein
MKQPTTKLSVFCPTPSTCVAINWLASAAAAVRRCSMSAKLPIPKRSSSRVNHGGSALTISWK